MKKNLEKGEYRFDWEWREEIEVGRKKNYSNNLFNFLGENIQEQKFEEKKGEYLFAWEWREEIEVCAWKCTMDNNTRQPYHHV